MDRDSDSVPQWRQTRAFEKRGKTFVSHQIKKVEYVRQDNGCSGGKRQQYLYKTGWAWTRQENGEEAESNKASQRDREREKSLVEDELRLIVPWARPARFFSLDAPIDTMPSSSSSSSVYIYTNRDTIKYTIRTRQRVHPVRRDSKWYWILISNINGKYVISRDETRLHCEADAVSANRWPNKEKRFRIFPLKDARLVYISPANKISSPVMCYFGFFFFISFRKGGRLVCGLFVSGNIRRDGEEMQWPTMPRWTGRILSAMRCATIQ